MKTAILALVFAIPVSLVADFIGLALGEADAAIEPCVAPVHATPEVMPPKAQTGTPEKRPSRRFIRTA